jgi:hypothetical protein
VLDQVAVLYQAGSPDGFTFVKVAAQRTVASKEIP